MKIASAIASLTVLTVSAFAQTKPAASYRVDYAMHEIEQGKRVNTRTYSLVLQDRGRGSVRIGNKVPVTTGTGTQFIDIGFNLDCLLVERDAMISIDTSVETSGAETDQQGKAAPVIRQVRASASSILSLGKPASVIQMDDITAKRRFDIEVTVTKLL